MIKRPSLGGRLIGVVVEQLRELAQRRERCAKLVRHGGDEVRLQLGDGKFPRDRAHDEIAAREDEADEDCQTGEEQPAAGGERVKVGTQVGAADEDAPRQLRDRGGAGLSGGGVRRQCAEDGLALGVRERHPESTGVHCRERPIEPLPLLETWPRHQDQQPIARRLP